MFPPNDWMRVVEVAKNDTLGLRDVIEWESNVSRLTGDGLLPSSAGGVTTTELQGVTIISIDVASFLIYKSKENKAIPKNAGEDVGCRVPNELLGATCKQNEKKNGYGPKKEQWA